MANQSVGEWLEERYSGYDGGVTTANRGVEERILEDHENLGVVMPRIGYKRYGFGLSHMVAHRFAQNVGALNLGFAARLTNCGMAAITTVTHVLTLAMRDKLVRIISGDVLYGETPRVLDDYGAFPGFPGPAREVHRVNSGALSAIQDAVDQRSRVDDELADQGSGHFQFFETVGNGPTMPVLDLEGLFRMFWDAQETIVLNNTLLTCALFNPFEIYARLRRELGEPEMNFVYVESFSKHYRVSDADPVTAGIIVASPDLIAECDAVIMRTGAYLPFPCLRELPVDIHAAAERVMRPLSQNARVVARMLREHRAVSEVGYPDDKFANGLAGGVLFFVPYVGVLNEAEIAARMERVFGAYKGSFGHAHTSWLPWGNFFEGVHPATIRLAVGFRDSAEKIVGKLRDAFDH